MSKTSMRCLLLACTVALLALGGCSTESRHRTIVYDEAWSNAAALKNLLCSADTQASCEREAKDRQRSFAESLSAAFHASPQCRTVQFLTPATGAANLRPD